MVMPSSSTSEPKTRYSALALAALVLIAVVFFWKILFLDEVSITYNLFREFPWKSQATLEQAARPSMNMDCIQSYYPRRAFATHTIRSGEIPLWNPYDFSGAPFLANVQSAVFYPVNIVLYLADPLRAMGYYLVFHFALAGVFMFLFVRSLGAGVFASFLGGLTLMLCGFFVTRTGHPTFVASAAWVPALLWSAERLLQRPGLGRAILLALCHAAMILSGFPQIAIHATYALAAYALWRVWRAGRSRDEARWRPLAWMLGALAFSGCLSLVQILPAYEFTRFCSRRFLPYESILSSAHHPACLIKYLIPDFLGHPLDDNLWSIALKRGDGFFSQNYWSTTGYVGILTLLLAGVGGGSRRRGAWFFTGTAVITLTIVLGTPLLRAAYLLPGFDFSRVDRLIYLYMLAMAVLAAFGVDRLDRAESPRGRVWIPVASAALLYWVAFVVVDLRPERLYGAITQGRFEPLSGWSDVRPAAVRAGVFLAAGAGLITLRLWNRVPRIAFRTGVVVLILVDLVPFGYRLNVSRPYEDAFPPVPIARQLQHAPEPRRILRLYGDVLIPNTASIYGIADAQGYNALTLDGYMELAERIQPGITTWRRVTNLTDPAATESPICDLLAVERFLTVEWPPGRPPRTVAVPNPGALPRASLIRRAETVTDPEALLGRLSSPDFDPRDVVYLSADEGDEVPESLAPANGTTGPPGAARIVEYRANEVIVEADAGEDAWLLLSETYYPGWKAWVDGERAKIWRADHVLRAVRVPAGRHRIRFSYAPWTFRVGGAASLVALGLAVLGLVLPARFPRPGES